MPLDVFDPAELIERIRQLYNAREGWLAPFPWCEEFHFHLDSIFTKLRVVSRTKTRGVVTANTVTMSEIFKPHEEFPQPIRTVLIEGKPGMGKTTYCRKLVYDWATGKPWTAGELHATGKPRATAEPRATGKSRATGEQSATGKSSTTGEQEEKDCFPRFEIVLLLKCRDMESNLWEAIDDQLLPREVQEHVREKFFNFIRQNQTDVLLVLDGLDEVPTSKLPVFAEIIQGRRDLPECHVVATARHEAGIKVRIHCDNLLEIEGFTEEDARTFIFKYFTKAKENLAKKLLSKLRSDKNLKDIAANPLNTALLCLVWEDRGGSFPESRTQLHVDITQCILRRYRMKKGLPETNGDLIDIYDAQLKHLGCLALNGLLEDRLDFEEGELKSHADELPGFGFLSVETGSSKRKPCRRYNFQHKSFQEWFAAFFLSCELIEKKISPESLVVDRRYAHELKEVLPYMCGLLAARYKEDAVNLTKCMMKEVNKGGEAWMSVVLECTRECKQNNSFQEELTRELGLLLELQTLRLDDRQIRASHVDVLSDALKSNTTLTELNLSSNFIGDAGAASVADALKSNTTLTKLNLSSNGIGAAGAASVADALKSNSTLTKLNLSENDIGDAGAASVADALKFNTTLTKLNLSSNGIGAAGSASVADALKSNTTLTKLKLSSNGIGAAGAASVADALKSNSTLTELNLSENDIGDAGAASVADALKSNTTLTELNLSENGIGAAGAASVADALKSNTTLTELNLSENDIGDAGAASVADALKFNTTLTKLNLSQNFIGDAGAASVADALKSNATLTELNLYFNGIGDAGATALADALKSNTTLTELNLSFNGIGDAGATALADALKSNTTLTELDLFGN